jgi:opacity protein-like surface antigen
MAVEIWQGSSSFSSGDTPYGFYDSDSEFTSSIDKFSVWASRRLGYPIVDIEMQSSSFYACFEEAVTEYSSQVNQFNIRDNLLHLQGRSTGSSLTGQRITPTLGRAVFLSQQYGTEAGAGGFVDWKKGSISIESGSQDYDLNALYANASESNAAIEVKKIYHEAPAAVNKYFDPYATTGYGTANFVEGFGFGNYSPAVSFVLMPVFEDLLRMQAIEINDQIRKSSYSFTLTNNKLRIFPIPKSNTRLYFDYVLTSERNNALITEYSGSSSVVSDYSNVPYNNMEYQFINDVGKQWIRKYGLALCKELLGNIRSKFSSIPIPNSELNMDGETLRSEAATEKESLVAELRETLEAMSRKTLMEADSEESERLQEKLNKVPLALYIG